MIEAGTHGAVVRQEALASNAALHLIDEKPAIKLAKGVWSSGRTARLVACTATGQAPRALHDDIGTLHAKYLASRVARLENEAWRLIASVQLLIRTEWREVNPYFPDTQSEAEVGDEDKAGE